MTETGRQRIMGLGLMVASGAILFGIHSGKMDTQGHPWLLISIVVVFFLAGVKLVTGVAGRGSDVIGGVVLAFMSSMGAYIAVRNLSLRGGIPFMPQAGNQVLGRMLFGTGAVLTGGAAFWFFRRALRRKAPDKVPGATSKPPPGTDFSAQSERE